MELITLHDARREPITFLYATERRLRSSTESSLGCCATAFMWSTISSKLSGGRKIHERAPGGGGGGGGGGEHQGAAVQGGRRRGQDQSVLRSEHGLSVYLPELKAQARAHTHAPAETTRTSERHTKRETKKQHTKKERKKSRFVRTPLFSFSRATSQRRTLGSSEVKSAGWKKRAHVHPARGLQRDANPGGCRHALGRLRGKRVWKVVR